MDFFEMDFSKLFLNKHGKTVFEDITNKIKQEKMSECNLEYISIVFKIAFLDFFGLDKLAMQKLIDSIYVDKQIDVKNILLHHRKSISIIKMYLQSTTDTC